MVSNFQFRANVGKIPWANFQHVIMCVFLVRDSGLSRGSVVNVKSRKNDLSV